MTYINNVIQSGLTLLFAFSLMAISYGAQAERLLGEIVGEQQDLFYVLLPSETRLEVGQSLPVVWVLDGQEIDSATVEVVDARGDLVTVRSVQGDAAIGMYVVIVEPVAVTTPDDESDEQNDDTLVEAQSNVPETEVNKNDVQESDIQPVITPENSADASGSSDAIDSSQSVGGELATTTAESSAGNEITTSVESENWSSQKFLVKSKAMTRFGRAFAHEKAKTEIGYRKAIRLYRKVAKRGYSKAQYRLAWLLENGLGADRNLGEAMQWYRLAASQGHKKANLGLQRLEAKF